MKYHFDLNEQYRIVAELDALPAEVDALKRLQAETAQELDALLPGKWKVERVGPRIMTFFRILKIKCSRLRTAPVSTELRRGKSPRQAIGHSSVFM